MDEVRRSTGPRQYIGGGGGLWRSESAKRRGFQAKMSGQYEARRGVRSGLGGGGGGTLITPAPDSKKGKWRNLQKRG